MDGADSFSWDALLQTVQRDFPDLFRTWFHELEPALIESGELIIRVPDPIRGRYLREACTDAFIRAAMTETGHLVAARIECPTEPPPLDDLRLTQLPLNADYTFEEFVVGPSNRLAHAAARAVCGQPGTLYNPLFIHGFSGLGKSHLMQAICAEFLRANPPLNVLYVSSETFVNDFVRAMGNARLQDLRDSIRRADALIIDDIQFLAHRESTQEEFFHTFNVLHQSRRQLIVSADSLPTAIPTLEERLISRFKWGLVAEIGPPDRETRQAILHRKAQLRGVEVANEVIDFIAERVPGNIRLLEGALTKLITESQVSGQPLTLLTARELLDGFNGDSQRALRIGDIIDAVARHFGVRIADIIGRRRNRSVSHPRQVGMYLARRLTAMSLEEIGAHFGGRNHATVLHAERAVESDRALDPRVADAVTQLTRQLQARK